MNFKIFFLLIIIGLVITACPTDVGGGSGDSSSSGSSSSGGGNGGGAREASLVVSSLSASEYGDPDDKITLNWEAVEGVDSYTIYRYKNSPATNGYELDAKISGIDKDAVLYNDTVVGLEIPALTENTAYFYKIACVKNGSELDKSSGYAAGIYSDVKEEFESINDTCLNTDFQDKYSTVPTIDTDYYAYFHSFTDKDNNNLESDEDWYKYTAASDDTAFFYINLEGAITVETGDLRYQLLCDGQVLKEGSVQKSGLTDVSISNPVAGKVYLLTIYSDNGTLNTTQYYKVRIEQGF